MVKHCKVQQHLHLTIAHYMANNRITNLPHTVNSAKCLFVISMTNKNVAKQSDVRYENIGSFMVSNVSDTNSRNQISLTAII